MGVSWKPILGGYGVQGKGAGLLSAGVMGFLRLPGGIGANVMPLPTRGGSAAAGTAAGLAFLVTGLAISPAWMFLI